MPLNDDDHSLLQRIEERVSHMVSEMERLRDGLDTRFASKWVEKLMVYLIGGVVLSVVAVLLRVSLT